MVEWRVVLHHGAVPDRSVLLLATEGLQQRNMDADLAAWRNASRILGLPGLHKDVDSFSELAWENAQAETGPAAAPADRAMAEQPDHSEIRVRRGILAWVVPLFLTLAGVTVLYQEIIYRGLDAVLAENGFLAAFASLGLVAVWCWTLTAHRVQLTPHEVVIASSLGPVAYRTRTVARLTLRTVSASFNHYGAGSVSLHSEGLAPVYIPNIRSSDARRLRQFMTQAIEATSTTARSHPTDAS